MKAGDKKDELQILIKPHLMASKRPQTSTNSFKFNSSYTVPGFFDSSVEKPTVSALRNKETQDKLYTSVESPMNLRNQNVEFKDAINSAE